MLNFCNIIRPTAIVITTLALTSILFPGFLEQYWPYLAAVAVLIVPAVIYRWWDQRYNPGCSVQFRNQPEPATED